MTYRATKHELETVFAAMQKAAIGVGIIPPVGFSWELEMGSKLYGRIYAMYWRRDINGALYPPGSLRDYLGLTKAEAVSTLWTIATALTAAREAMDKMECEQ